MSDQYFVGQRWISNAEKELGLGIVVDTESRRVSISFPASGEQRTYAQTNAPLTRVKYDIGESIQDIDENVYTVTDIHEQGHIVYAVTDAKGTAKALSEVELNPFVHFSGPLERLTAGNLDHPRHFQLRLSTLEHQQRLQASGVEGLLGARADTLPHQIYIASDVAHRFAPRVLLADEVGLGKTIEAGMIIHSQLHTGRSKRVLVIVPDSLVHQWLVEMLRRFNLRFSIMDSRRVQDQMEFDSANPFDSAQLILCPLSFIEQPEYLDLAAESDWDILCVDEAHHLQWSTTGASSQYTAVERLAKGARGLLLLTATPEQLGKASHFARLRLLDSDRYHDLDAFIAEEEQYQSLNQTIQRLLSSDSLDAVLADSVLVESLAAYLGENTLAEIATQAKAQADVEVLKSKLTQQLLDRHGTGRVLFRNTRASVAGFPERVLTSYGLDLPADWASTQLYPERLADGDWITVDPRVQWLKQFLKTTARGEKVLLITANAETALDLEAFLRLRQGLNTTVFHEGMSLVERDRAAAYFADGEEGAQMLVCSEIGSEGRNFQFAHHLVLFDLPQNPDLLEQRIGRLDRIGQQNTVQLHVPYFTGTAQEVLLQWYHRGINAFEQTCPAGGLLRAQFSERLEAALAAPQERETLDTLITETAEYYAQTLAQLEAGRDKLLELNSCNQEQAQSIIERIKAAEDVAGLSAYMQLSFDQFGVDHHHHSESAWVLEPTENMHEPFPELPEDGLSVCFDRSKALAREELAFLTWEHPMVTATMDRVLSGDHGNSSVCSIKLPPLKAGTWLLEAIYVLHCPAPKAHQLNRVLPTTPIRLLLETSGKDLAHALPGNKLTQLAQKIPAKTAANIVKAIKSELEPRVAMAKAMAQRQADQLINSAKTDLQRDLQSELDRMKALATVNPSIRPEEIAHLDTQLIQGLGYIDQTQVRLDAVRIIVVDN